MNELQFTDIDIEEGRWVISVNERCVRVYSSVETFRVAKQTQISDNIAGCLLDVLRVSFSVFLYPRVFRCVCCSHVKVENNIWRLWPKHWMALDLIQDGCYSFMNEIQRLSVLAHMLILFTRSFWEMNWEWYESIRIRMKRRILVMFFLAYITMTDRQKKFVTSG